MYLSLNQGRPGVMDMEDYGDMGDPGPVFEISSLHATYNNWHIGDKEEEKLKRYDDCFYYDGYLWGNIQILEDHAGKTDVFEVEKAQADEIRICPNVFHDTFHLSPDYVTGGDIWRVFRIPANGEWRKEESHNWEWYVYEV